MLRMPRYRTIFCVPLKVPRSDVPISMPLNTLLTVGMRV